MRKSHRRLIGLCLVPVLLAMLDGTLTLIGQSAEYWSGDYSQVLEGTPGFRILLSFGPAAYFAGYAIYMSAFAGMILMLPRTLAVAICLQFTLGHTIGAFSWLNRFPDGRMLPVFINAIAAFSLAFGIRAVWSITPADDTPLGASLSTTTRWGVVAILFLITVSPLLPW